MKIFSFLNKLLFKQNMTKDKYSKVEIPDDVILNTLEVKCLNLECNNLSETYNSYAKIPNFRILKLDKEENVYYAVSKKMRCKDYLQDTFYYLVTGKLADNYIYGFYLSDLHKNNLTLENCVIELSFPHHDKENKNCNKYYLNLIKTIKDFENKTNLNNSIKLKLNTPNSIIIKISDYYANKPALLSLLFSIIRIGVYSDKGIDNIFKYAKMFKYLKYHDLDRIEYYKKAFSNIDKVKNYTWSDYSKVKKSEYISNIHNNSGIISYIKKYLV